MPSPEAKRAIDRIAEVIEIAPHAVDDPGFRDALAGVVGRAFSEKIEMLERLTLFAENVRDLPVWEIDKALDWIGERREEAERLLDTLAPKPARSVRRL